MTRHVAYGVLSTIISQLRSRLTASRRSPCSPTHVKRLDTPNDRLSAELIHVGQLRDGDYVLCVPGDIVPRDGKVVDGTAVVKNLVNEAPLAESALQALRVGSTVGAGSRVLARFIVVQIGRYNSSTSR